MADFIYNIYQDTPESLPNIETFSQEDTSLVSSFQINQVFNSTKNTVELHIYNLAGELQESDYNYVNYKELGNAQSAGKEGASVLTIDVVDDLERYGYDVGGVKLFYNFINDLFSTSKTSSEFFIDSISPDRTELKLNTLQLTPQELIDFTTAVKNSLQDPSYFNEFRLNFKNNELLIGINIDTIQDSTGTYVVVKLYEPLPEDIIERSTLSIVELINDSVVYQIDTTIQTEPETSTNLRSPNFNLEITDANVIPTQYYNYNALFSYPVSNTNNELYSLVNSKGVQLSIDHSDYSNFVHFSSAQERLLNFKYKLDLIKTYTDEIASIQSLTSPSIGTTGSINYYQGLVEGIVNNFDHYENFLYYTSGSYSWPKTNSVKPYTNDTTSATGSWFNSQLTVAAKYDVTNTNILTNSIPSFLRDDPNNQNYLTFVYMIGQHFDNMWLYAKGVSDKYDADNRLDFGISKDLVAEVLKNFGVKLYTSNKSIEDLFGSFIGQAYQSGSEVINTYVTGSVTGSNTPIQPSSLDNYQREVYKRIYHNLPLLTKSKGTERGLRALINCFGIPSDILDIKIYGGRNVNQRPFYGDFRYYTSSLDKIRLDNTGSIVSGSTLSQYTSILKREYKYTDDLHPIEIGFSPTDNVDNYIISKSLSTGSLSNFNIDDYLGDPRNLYLDNYYTFSPTGGITGSLDLLTDRIMSGSTAYNVYDFVRLIKFFDNTIFKMVKDFIPARSTADTGIIIKPHLLQRNKAKSVLVSGSRPEYTGSIGTAFIGGNSGGSYNAATTYYNTSYTDIIQTPDGLSGPITEPGINININPVSSHAHEEARFNGELNNSEIEVSNGELNQANIYKAIENVSYPYNINFVSASDEICLLGITPGTSSPIYITSSTATLSSTDLFVYTNASSQYTASIPKAGGTPTSITFPTSIQALQGTFTGLTQYSTGSIKVKNANYTLGECTSSIDFIYATCSIWLSQTGQDINDVVVSPYPNPGDIEDYDLTTWFNYDLAQNNLVYTITVGVTTTTINTPNSYQFPPTFAGNTGTITISDPKAGPGCKLSKRVNITNCNIGGIASGSEGLPFLYSKNPPHPLFFPDINTGFNYDTETPFGASNQASVNTSLSLIRYVQPLGPGNSGKGIQGFFTPYPPDAGTTYSVYFVRKPGNYWIADTVISNLTNQQYVVQALAEGYSVPTGNAPSTSPGANPPIMIQTPFSNIVTVITDSFGNVTGYTYADYGPTQIVQLIVIDATLPGGCTKRVVLYPTTAVAQTGTVTFTPVDIPIDYNTAYLGVPIAGIPTLYNVPVRTYQ